MSANALIFARLVADGTLTARLAIYNGAPAIFSDVAPDDFMQQAAPSLIIRAPTTDRPDDTFTSKGRALEQPVSIYALRTASSQLIDEVADRARLLFHNQEAALGVVIATVLGPVDAPTTDAAVIGRQITIRLNTEEN